MENEYGLSRSDAAGWSSRSLRVPEPKTTNAAIHSNVPKMMLRFAASPLKFASTGHLLHELATEPDAENFRMHYEMTFGEPLHTFFEDGRIKVLADLIETAKNLSLQRFLARCTTELLRLESSSPAQGTRNAGDVAPDKEDSIQFDVLLNRTESEISILDQKLKALLKELYALDPKIARRAEKFAYGP